MKDIKEVRQELDFFINMDLCAYCEYEGACDLSIGVCGKEQAKNALKRFINDTENLIKENQILVVENDGYKEANRELYKENEELRKQAIEMRDNFQETIRERNYNGERFNTLHDSQAIEPSVLEKIDKLEKENKELKKAYEYEKNYKNNLEKQLVENSQAIEPSVLEKIDRLETENKYLNTMVECMGYELMDCEWWGRYASGYDKTIEDIILYFQYKHTNRDPYTKENYVKNVIDKLEKELQIWQVEYAVKDKAVKMQIEEIRDLEKKLSITDKALDKACSMLEHLVPNVNESKYTSWKDYLLKESEKENA